MESASRSGFPLELEEDNVVGILMGKTMEAKSFDKT